eukprot:4513234-Pyramimonas_sp.AAC.1
MPKLSYFMRYEAAVVLAGACACASLFIETKETAAPTGVALPLQNGNFLTAQTRQRPSRIFDKAVDYYNVEA